MTRRALVALALTIAGACSSSAKDQAARADSMRQDSLMLAAQAAALKAESARSDSMAAAQARGAGGAAVKGRAGTTGATGARTVGATGATGSTGPMIGRDSVDPRPKIKGLPIIPDTVKRRPPR